MKETYTIPEVNLSLFEEKLEKLNKKAHKLNCTPIVYETEPAYDLAEYVSLDGEHLWAEQEKVDKLAANGLHTTGRIRRYLHLTIEGETPKYEGWTLLGVLEPLTLDDGTKENLILAVPGCKIPAKYRDMVGVCDHCKTKRYRTQTFVVKNGRKTRAVGRQCIKDFLGHVDPHVVAKQVEWLVELSSLCCEAERDEWSKGSREQEAWSLQFFLRATAAVIKHQGWLSRTKAKEQDFDMATADHVLLYLNPPNKQYQTKELKRWLQDILGLAISEVMEETASKAIEWAKSLPDKEIEGSDYLYNVNLLARSGIVSPKTAGIAASIVYVYQRSLERENVSPSNHVGTEGKRTTLHVTCDNVRPLESHYGTTGLHKMHDKQGNDIVWFASSSTEWLEDGCEYDIAATVKRHDEYKGRKQTIVTRVKVLQEKGAV